MDHKLAVDFVKKIRLAGTVLRLRPALSAQDSNALIELAVGYFSDEPLNWFQLVFLESKYSTTYDEARIYGLRHNDTGQRHAACGGIYLDL
jgi:hypothetical protein